MTWEDVIRCYPNQWVIFEVTYTGLQVPPPRLLCVLESECDPHQILQRCNDLAHSDTRRIVHFAHTSWATPHQELPLRTLPTGKGVAV